MRESNATACGFVPGGKNDNSALGAFAGVPSAAAEADARPKMAFRAAGCVTKVSCSLGGKPNLETITSSWWRGLEPWKKGLRPSISAKMQPSDQISTVLP